jgi:DNA invertase Pin-like site-specific DNA recombinase
MSKITAEHLGRSAIVYIRQSTSYQVANNLESQRRQYALVERGSLLGWNDVQVIDDDLGRSGGGIARPGFEKLLAAICEGRVGAVLSIEASRLARNGRDWHTLLEEQILNANGCAWSRQAVLSVGRDCFGYQRAQ